MDAQMPIKTVKQPSGAVTYLMAHSLSTSFLGINGTFSFVDHRFTHLASLIKCNIVIDEEKLAYINNLLKDQKNVEGWFIRNVIKITF